MVHPRVSRCARHSILAVGLFLLLAACGTPAGAVGQSGKWNGTIVLTREASASYNKDTEAHTDKHADTLKEIITITVTNGKAEAAIDYLLKEHVDGFSANEGVTETTKIDRVTKGTGTTTASFEIQTYDDGTYALSFTTGSIKGTIDSVTTVDIKCKTEDNGCHSGIQTTKASDKVNDLSGGAGEVTASIAGKPNALAGSAPQDFEFAEKTRQGSIQWSLKR